MNEREDYLKSVKGLLGTIAHPKLALGVDATEKEIEKRFNQSYAFLNISQKEPANPRAISADFNNLEHLEELVKHFPQTFEIIALDDSTFKFTSWTAEHLRCLKAMLKTNGQFIFGPFIGGTGLSYDSYANWEELTERIRKEAFPSQQLITSFTLPCQMPTPANPENYEGKVNVLFEKHIQLRGIPEQEIDEKLESLGLNEYYPEVVLNDSQELLQALRNNLYQNAFCEYFFREVIIPDNYRKIMTEVFGQENIQIEFDKPLPFESRYNKQQSVLITAIKK